ncbi:MAG: cytochrome C biogenesis protein [Desulfobulbaceae bacterium]|nr:cytochrome C biogenesis protein [Desulfobulbaceae bacterium]
MNLIMQSITGPFSYIGQGIMIALLAFSLLGGIMGVMNVSRKDSVAFPVLQWTFVGINLIFMAGFVLICWLHYQIYQTLPLEFPEAIVPLVNQQLELINAQAQYAFPLLDPAHPPRYVIPLWVENEKYYFWFTCYSFMAFFAFLHTASHRLKGALVVLLTLQISILYWFANPFSQPLPKFFSEIGAWYAAGDDPRQMFGEFMRLYPRMIFYYNTHYMWLHPPMLFLSYSAITVTFITSVFMLVKRDVEIETLGYDSAKFGYFMLTLGMLLGYPWALQAWGPNWWWDPKICSSIMMWAIYSTYLHTRLYANKKLMWYFTSILGIVCFVAMIFTFISSFYFPGEHTFQ